MKDIYIMLSHTHTMFGGVIRRVKGLYYNHSAISFDKELLELYAFARPKHKALMLATLVHENVERYTLGKHTNVPVAVFRLSITDEQYDWLRQKIKEIQQDGRYIYNMYSVLTNSFTGGFATYKAFSCTEFVAYLLSNIGVNTEKPYYSYTPDDLKNLLSEYLCFEGNMLDFANDRKVYKEYYDSLTAQEIMSSIFLPVRLLYRMIFCRRKMQKTEE